MTQDETSKVTESDLLDRLSQLPRSVAPASDPWPHIEARIREHDARRRTPLRWMSVAASVAVAFAVGIYIGDRLDLPSSDNAAALQAPALAEQSSADPVLGFRGALVGAEREYQAAFSQFIAVARAGTEIGSATIEQLENDWQEILEAESALMTALEQHPENSLLNRQLLELRDRQLGLLKQLAGLDRASRRTEI